MESYPLEFPLIHPKVVQRDRMFEVKTSKLVLYPFSLKTSVLKVLRAVLGIPFDTSTKDFIKKKMGGDKNGKI